MQKLDGHTIELFRRSRREQFESDLRRRLSAKHGGPSAMSGSDPIDATIAELRVYEGQGLFVQRNNLIRLAFLLHEYGPSLSRHREPYQLDGILHRRHLSESIRLDLADALDLQSEEP